LSAFGIYIHWPFCAAKCPYCDFNSHVRRAGVDEARYARAFAGEMRYLAPHIGRREISSIFIGGGTPSLMTPQTLEAILKAVTDYWHVATNAEITLEANPSSADAANFRAYQSIGINRLSLGVQALNDAALKQLGRLHDVAQAMQAIELARQVFPRLSFDLIYARPDQEIKDWQAELEQAINLAADHLSLYQLTIEDGTPFQRQYARGKLLLPTDEKAASLYALTQEITEKRGLPAYEISNHASKGAQSQHNLLYWRYGEYAGFGPGAHGRFIEAGRDSKMRRVTMMERQPERWLTQVETTGNGIVGEEYLKAEEQGDEMLLMGLRLHEGLDLVAYEQLAGKRLDGAKLGELQQAGLVEMADNTHIRATQQGRVVLDHIITQLA